MAKRQLILKQVTVLMKVWKKFTQNKSLEVSRKYLLILSSGFVSHVFKNERLEQYITSMHGCKQSQRR